MNEMAAIASVIGAILGAVAMLGREMLVGRAGAEARHEDHQQKTDLTLWSELRNELTELRKEIDSVRAEVDLWKGKYWALMDEHMTLKAQYMSVQTEVTDLRQLVQAKAASN